jgi:hypothetical protein
VLNGSDDDDDDDDDDHDDDDDDYDDDDSHVLSDCSVIMANIVASLLIRRGVKLAVVLVSSSMFEKQAIKDF